MFSAWIDHGVDPGGATYAYVLPPGASNEETKTYAAEPRVRILANTEAVQAVHHEGLGLTGIVFHEMGSIGGISVSRPCVVLVDADQISVADPAQQNEPVVITLGRVDDALVFQPRTGRTQTLPRPR